MRTHQQIDARSLAMARAIVARIDHDPARAGLAQARATCERWYKRNPAPAVQEWMRILERPWEHVREVLLADTEEGQRLRQSAPFGGSLTPQERSEIYREYSDTR